MRGAGAGDGWGAAMIETKCLIMALIKIGLNQKKKILLPIRWWIRTSHPPTPTNNPHSGKKNWSDPNGAGAGTGRNGSRVD